ncbi:hypothetical protein RRG08_001278, partial [Elysia crispata]
MSTFPRYYLVFSVNGELGAAVYYQQKPSALRLFNLHLASTQDLNSAVVRYSGDLMRNIGGEPLKIPEYLDTVMDSIGNQKALLNGSE